MLQQKRQILIATEFDKFNTLLSNAFREKGWIVYTAKDGQQSVRKVRWYDPDIVVMDIEMPVRDGIEACRIIKNDIALAKNYPVILMGNSPDRKKIISAIEAGCDDFLIKPFNFDVLFSKVDTFVGFYRKKTKAMEVSTPSQLEQEAKVIIYSRQMIKKVFLNAMHGKLLDYPVVQKVVQNMKEILYNKRSLPMALKMKSYNDYTYVHSINVTFLCLSFAYHLKWDDYDMQFLGEGAFLHDIGKTKIDLQILMKPGKLNKTEFLEMKKHPQYAKEIILNGNINNKILKVPLEHHERIGGGGYPQNLYNKQISKYGKLAAIVDVYDALTTDRCYHAAVDSIEAIDIMAKEGNQFDPDLFKIFKNLISSQTIGK